MKSFAPSSWAARHRAACRRCCAALAAFGLLLGSSALAAPRKVAVTDDRVQITFTGFDEHEGGASRLYVKLSRPVTVQPTVSGTHLEYLLVGATIPIRNNENPLITRHFGAQVVSAKLVTERAEKPRRGVKGKARARASGEPEAVRLVVETREPVNPPHRVIRNADGTAVLVIDFPKPSKPPPPEPDVIAPPPKAAKASQVVPVD